MRRAHVAQFSFLFVAISGGTYACADDRIRFEQPPEEAFDIDSGVVSDDAAAAPACQLQCSLDRRTVFDTCTKEVVVECRPEDVCGGGTCLAPCEASAADRHSDGCEFFVQAPHYRMHQSPPMPPSCFATYVVNTSPLPAEVELELEGKKIDISRSLYRTAPGSSELVRHTGPVAPGDSAILFLSDATPEMAAELVTHHYYIGCPNNVTPAVTVDRFGSFSTRGTSFRIGSTMPVALTSIYPFGGAESAVPTATLLLPVPTWSKEHILINAWGKNPYGGPSAQIVASEDGTEVTILPSRDVQNGVGVIGGPAGQPITYRLDRGEHLQLVQDEELTGSIVTSNKPTTIFGGHACGRVPASAPACDILTQQIPAFEQWGSEYVGVGYRPRGGNEHEMVPYRIVASSDGTRLDYDPAVPPGAPTTMNAGDVATFSSGTGDAFVVRTQDSEHPIYVAAYMTGADGDGRDAKNYAERGDAEFVNLVPTGQYLNEYSFYADPTYKDTSLVIVRAKHDGKFHDVWLECAGTLTGFKTIGTRGDYEFMRVDLSRNGGPGDTNDAGTCQYGVQRMRSDGPFTATIWGVDRYASYAYPGGMAHRKLVQRSLDSVVK